METNTVLFEVVHCINHIVISFHHVLHIFSMDISKGAIKKTPKSIWLEGE